MASATEGAAAPSTQKIASVISTFRPAKAFKIGSNAHSTSLDFDDGGEYLLSANSDESLKLYNAREGKEEKTLLSKKYGCHLARFTHHSSAIIYASTKGDDNIRYLSTHDNSYLRYFRGHTAPVTALAMSPGSDSFLSCSLDNTLRLWDLRTASWQGMLKIATPTLCAWDPTASVMAVASPSTGTVLLYDQRNYDKPPFANFDLLSEANLTSPHIQQAGAAAGSSGIAGMPRDWTTLEFSNDGKTILLGTNNNAGHILLDAFDGTVRAFLVRPEQYLPLKPALQRATPWPDMLEGKAAGGRSQPLGQGDVCLTSDAHYVIGASGGDGDLVVWDISDDHQQSAAAAAAAAGSAGTPSGQPMASRAPLRPMTTLPCKKSQGVVAFNPRYNMFATGESSVMMWIPDEHSSSSAGPASRPS